MAAIDAVAHRCNDAIHEREARERVAVLQMSFDGATLVAPGRRLLQQLPATAVDTGRQRLLVVFSDEVIVGAPSSVRPQSRLSVESASRAAMADHVIWMIAHEFPLETLVVNLLEDTLVLRSSNTVVPLRMANAAEALTAVQAAIQARLHASVFFREQRLKVLCFHHHWHS